MKIRNVACYSFSLNAQEPMAYLRLIAPFRELGINIIKGIDDNGQFDLEGVHQGDLVVIQREVPIRYDAYRQIIALAKQEGKPIVFELDDLFFKFPDTHPDRKRQYYAPSLLPMFHALIEADIVTTTTPKMRDVLVEFNQNMAVIPNYFDENLWRLAPPVQRSSSSDKLTIGYMGTNSHKSDLDYILPVLRSITQRYPEKIQFHFWGVQPPTELEAFAQVQWSQKYFSSYPDFAEFFQTQLADIFIAPLSDSLFNRCKSSIKFFEYSALGSPGVYSRLEPYSDIVSHGKNGLLASSMDEWEASLIQLIQNDELRFQLAENAQTTIRNNWLLSQNVHLWNDVFRQAFESASRKDQTDSSMTSVIDSINNQLFETFTKKDAVEKSLRARLAEQDQTLKEKDFQLEQARDEIEQLKAEILSYVLSKSWRMTRPVRKAGRKLKKSAG